MRTIDDTTREEVAELVKASVGLLAMARFLVWLNGQEDEAEYKETNETMAAILNKIGVETITYDEFVFNLEGILKAGNMPSVPIGETKKA